MYTPPLFEPNILSTLLRNFSFYFHDGYWGYVFLVIMGLILFPFIWLRARPAAFSFPDRQNGRCLGFSGLYNPVCNYLQSGNESVCKF